MLHGSIVEESHGTNDRIKHNIAEATKKPSTNNQLNRQPKHNNNNKNKNQKQTTPEIKRKTTKKASN